MKTKIILILLGLMFLSLNTEAEAQTIRQFYTQDTLKAGDSVKVYEKRMQTHYMFLEVDSSASGDSVRVYQSTNGIVWTKIAVKNMSNDSVKTDITGIIEPTKFFILDPGMMWTKILLSNQTYSATRKKPFRLYGMQSLE